MPNYAIRKASSRLLPDRYYAKLAFFKHHGRFPRTPPVTFSERLSNLIGAGNLEQYRTYCDKMAIRDLVAHKIGPKHLVPLYASADRLTEDLWGRLPPAFMLKPNHGSGWSRLIRDKSQESFEAVSATAADWLSKDFYYIRRERQYRDIKPCLLFEKVLNSEPGDVLVDYKFFCFHGKAQLVQTTIRHPRKRRLLYDLDWNKLAVRYTVSNSGHISRPDALQEMRSIAETLAEGFDFVRVDLFSVKDGVFFGDLTLTPLAGSDRFEPPEFDEYLGELWANANAACNTMQWHEDATPARR